ncbi:ribonucleotide-diphosphate reductase subunit beta [Natronobiforma cellulositropha]|uniref:ribonucleotide-diphosphate reductase subunit beta n=1 Tax=Natronobiforma cellulositropha TaxID=1679076 RepID=UPI0021D5B714|nr:ribonucleotide-diphosphate reductase subunit beta [Natronobiforma cellulositropha]
MPSEEPRLRLDTERQSYRYYRNAVERHWDPAAIDLSSDRESITALSADSFDSVRGTIALFGAGEETVTEELAPLSVVLEDFTDQLYVTTQLYDEAKHAEFFDRYWERVVVPEERRRGLDPTGLLEERWFPPAYLELLERTETAMARLLTDDTPENRARAYCHYHLTIEGVLAQTGYYSVDQELRRNGTAALPGLLEGFDHIRTDEGRHVGFGMWKLKRLLADGVSPGVVEETTAPLVDLTVATVRESVVDETGYVGEKLATYAERKGEERLGQLFDEERLPAVDELVRLERSER